MAREIKVDIDRIPPDEGLAIVAELASAPEQDRIKLLGPLVDKAVDPALLPLSFVEKMQALKQLGEQISAAMGVGGPQGN